MLMLLSLAACKADAPGAAGGVANANDGAAAADANGAAIVYHGRFDLVTDPNLPTMSWPGTEMVFGFLGSKLTVTLGAPDPATYSGVTQGLFMAYAVDGGNTQPIQLAAAPTPYVLAQNLPQGQHFVRLAKMTEAQFGRVMFYGATTDGTMTYTPPASTRRLEFVGDSGTAGYGELGTYPCTFTTTTENGDAAYPALVGRLLGAEVHNISYSGKGLVQNRDVVNDAYKTMPILWQRTMPLDDPYVLWDANQWRPQAVVATVSGNDVYASIPTQAIFAQKIDGFATALRAAYPQALILFTVSPMLRTNDPHPGQRATIISYLQAAVAQAADANVQYLAVAQDNGFNGSNCATTGCDASDANCLGSCLGCDDHMYPPTHAIVADTIATALKSKLGW